MAYSLPNGSTFDVAATYGASVTVTAISNASPAVVTATAHGLTTGDYVIMTSGWTKMNNRIFKVTVVDPDSFSLQGTDTTDLTRYPALGGVGSCRSVATWVQIPQITGVDFTGGEQNMYTFQFLEDDDERQFPTNKSAITVTLTVADDPDQAYVSTVEKYDEDKTLNALRLNLVNGDEILYPAVVTISATPSLTVNELMTRTISLALQARPTRY